VVANNREEALIPNQNMNSTVQRVPPVSISIVEDDPIIREQLGLAIGKADDLRCLSQHRSAEAALRELPGLQPQVVLMDINLPGISGIECVRQLRGKLPRTQIIMLTVHEDIDSIFQSLLAGATGYLLKRTPRAQLFEGIRDVVRGGSPMNSSIARKVVQMIASQEKRRDGLAKLTDRESEVLEQLAKGRLYKEIAEQLGINIETVRTHIRAIYEKLQVHTRTEAVVKFLGN
jgi:DNA-binding NarL/FixJ family response regulator